MADRLQAARQLLGRQRVVEQISGAHPIERVVAHGAEVEPGAVAVERDAVETDLEGQKAVADAVGALRRHDDPVLRLRSRVVRQPLAHRPALDVDHEQRGVREAKGAGVGGKERAPVGSDAQILGEAADAALELVVDDAAVGGEVVRLQARARAVERGRRGQPKPILRVHGHAEDEAQVGLRGGVGVGARDTVDQLEQEGVAEAMRLREGVRVEEDAAVA